MSLGSGLTIALSRLVLPGSVRVLEVLVQFCVHARRY